MPISSRRIARRIAVGIMLALASSPADFAAKPQIADKAPKWKISPGGPNRFINSVAVSADGGRVIGGTFYHVYGKTESRRGPARPTDSTAPSEFGKFGVYCYDGAGTARWRDEFDAWQGVYWVGLSANGQRAAAGGFMTANMPQQGFVRAYNADTGALLLIRRTLQRVNQVALSADGTWLVSAAESLLVFRDPHGSPNSSTSQYQQTDDFSPGNDGGIVSVGISSDGSIVVYADYKGHIAVLANNGGKLAILATWKVPGDAAKGDFCHMIDLASDGTCFAAGGANGLFYFFEVPKVAGTPLQPTCTYNTNVHGAVYGVAVAGNGKLFAGVVNHEDQGYAYIVPVMNGPASIAIKCDTVHNPNSAALNATHGIMAVADGHPDGKPGAFYLFDTATGTQRWSSPTTNMSWPIVIAANGSAIVGGSDDTNIYYFTP